MNGIVTYLTSNWQTLLLIIIGVEKFLKLIDNLLPANVTVDNDIADFLAKLLKAINPLKKTP